MFWKHVPYRGNLRHVTMMQRIFSIKRTDLSEHFETKISCKCFLKLTLKI
ncbi:hypothetical protein KUCAC02_029097 [Chaenocephalus aceratus]|uniref:Uncharacterized protein n=1 Tax=Chaenocephalus aceratus TaxID=36190 RepID=A0ACB9X5U4_CHAAC|nr:hypothetical protein KUCAC02_029097 [Chaenocephalus aceratus]